MSTVRALSFFCGCVLESVHSQTTAIGLCSRHGGLYSEGMTIEQLADAIRGTLTVGVT